MHGKRPTAPSVGDPAVHAAEIQKPRSHQQIRIARRLNIGRTSVRRILA